MRRTLENPLVKKIVLRRCNRIKTCVSEKIAQQTQQWEVYDEGQLVSPMRIAITESELREHIGVNDAFYGDLLSSLQELRQPWIDVTYESLFHRESQRRLLDFLSVRNVDFELRASSVKQNSTDLRDTIINFSELAASLAASDLEADLYDCES